MVVSSRAARITGISPVVATAGGSVGFAGQAESAGACGAAPDPPDGPRPLLQFAARGPIRVGGELASVEPEVGARPTNGLDLGGHVTLMRFDPFRQFEQVMDRTSPERGRRGRCR